ncbi:MAG TPA: thermonuclease family protein [Blastocatellia bacterium]|nr:thermonuclease family protein [Blastocatellia bacterium]
MKRIVAFIFGLLLVGCSATLPPPTNLAVLITLSSPTPTLISDYEPTWQPVTITGKVVGVSDGDTITVLDAGNQQHKVRLVGIDAPESDQEYGSRAKQSLSDLVFGKTVTVFTLAKDRYGRVLGGKLDANERRRHSHGRAVVRPQGRENGGQISAFESGFSD